MKTVLSMTLAFASAATAANALVDAWNWTKVPIPDSVNKVIAINPDRTRYYTSQWRSDIQKQRLCSSNNPSATSTNWVCKDIAVPLARTSFAFDKANPKVAYAVVERNVMRTIDSGLTWTRIFSAPTPVERVYVSPRNGAIHIVNYSTSTTPAFLYTSTGGVFVPRQISNVPNLLCWSLLEDAKSGALYAAFEIATHPQPYDPPLYRSTDGGLSWVKMQMSNAWHVSSLVATDTTPEGLIFADRQIIWAQQEGAPMYYTETGGNSWILQQSNGLPVSDLIMPRLRAGMVLSHFPATSRPGLSWNWGKNWQQIAGVEQHDVPLAIDDRAPYKTWVAHYEKIPGQASYRITDWKIGQVSTVAPAVTGGTVAQTGPNTGTFTVDCYGCPLLTSASATLTQGSIVANGSILNTQIVFSGLVPGAATLKVGNSTAAVTLLQ